MLGIDVAAAAAAAGHEVLALSRAQLDISDTEAVVDAIGEALPDAVINCAAYTDVDGAESDPEGADAVNVVGASNVAAAAAAAGAWTVHVSTDYVFDGTKESPYVESDAIGPRSVYGATKLEGEQLVSMRTRGRYTIVRSSWLFGTGGPCFPATILRLASERDTLKVVDDQIGCPTFTGHLAPAGQCSWFEFAREILDRSDAGAVIEPCSTSEFPRPAPRPAYSVLRSERPEAPLLADWSAGLDAYLAARATA